MVDAPRGRVLPGRHHGPPGSSSTPGTGRPSSVTGAWSPDDAPLVKALLYLLVNSHFAADIRGSCLKRMESAWQRVLVSAAREHVEQYARRSEEKP